MSNRHESAIFVTNIVTNIT